MKRHESQPAGFMEGFLFLVDLLTGHEPAWRKPARDSVLECGRPLPLCLRAGPTESGRGLPHSKTSRSPERFMGSS